MKRTFGTVVVFILLVMTVIALNQLGNSHATSAQKTSNEGGINYGTQQPGF